MRNGHQQPYTTPGAARQRPRWGGEGPYRDDPVRGNDRVFDGRTVSLSLSLSLSLLLSYKTHRVAFLVSISCKLPFFCCCCVILSPFSFFFLSFAPSIIKNSRLQRRSVWNPGHQEDTDLFMAFPSLSKKEKTNKVVPGCHCKLR